MALSATSSRVSAATESSSSLLGYLGGLPLELWRVVLSYLNVPNLCKCIQVCKNWQLLVNSLDTTTWRRHFLRSDEWRHPTWPRSEDTFPVKSWQTAYKEHFLSSRLWSLGNRVVDQDRSSQKAEYNWETLQANCLHVFKKPRDPRVIKVGPRMEHRTLKSALTVAGDYDCIVLSPGVYDEQFEMSSKIPFEIIGDGELGSVVLLTCIEQASLSGRLCNLVLRAPWFTAHVIRVIHGHLQVDKCIIEDGQVSVQSPGTAHMKYCSFVKTQVTLVNLSLSLFENCEFIKSDNCAVVVDQPPKDGHCWVLPYLSLIADTYRIHKRTWVPPIKPSANKPKAAGMNKEDALDQLTQADDKESIISDTTSIISRSCLDVNDDGNNSPVPSDSSSDTSSDSHYSDSMIITQPWVGRARAAWAAEGPEPPSQWDVDPIPAIPSCLQQDMALRETLAEMRGAVFRRCVISECQGGISLSRQAHLRVEQCELKDLQYAIRCLHNTKLAAIENSIHHCSTSALFMRLGSGGIVVGNDIYCTAEAGIDIRKNAAPLIQHNRIHHSKRSGIVVLGNGKGTIKGNDIYQNREAGIYILYKGDPYVSGNRICHGAASGIAITEGGKGYILDNMISGNRWGGIDVRRGGDPRIIRNLICNGLADGIVIGIKGKATVEANCIRGNMGCGIWVMSGRPLIQSNQIYNNKDAGIVLVDKPDNEKGDYSMEESNSDSDTFESDTGAPTPRSALKDHHSSSVAYRESSKMGNSKHSILGIGGLPINIKYNSIYHNADIGIMCNISDRLLLVANAIHANRNIGICIKQPSLVNLRNCSITCNSGCGLQVAPNAKVELEGSGIYDNTGHGIRSEGEVTIQLSDILCNQMSSVWTEGEANVTIEMSRLYSPYDPVAVGSGSSRMEIAGNKIYKGRARDLSELHNESLCQMEDNEILEEHGHESFDKRGFDWQLEDPPPRPNIEAPPRVNIPATPARHMTTATRVMVPVTGGCQQGSKMCMIL